MSVSGLIKKIRKNGLKKSFRLGFESYVFSHWQLYLLERSLDNDRDLDIPEQPTMLTVDDLPVFARYFSSYMASFRQFFLDGSHAVAYLDEQGDAYFVYWIHAGSDYFDKPYSGCLVPVPADCIYQFAGELIKERRSRSGKFLLAAQQRIWRQYREQGYTRVRALVNSNNSVAIRFHQRCGFVETGKRAHSYRLFGYFKWTRWEEYQVPALS